MEIEDLITGIDSGMIRFRGITHDSRKVEPGFIFVAIPGKFHNGHDFIQHAIQNGAACIITERNLVSNVLSCHVDSIRTWLGPLAASVYRYPSRHMHTIGITGSNGKTTIATMIHSFYTESRIPCGLIGTVENHINGIRTPATLTTPEAPDLQKMMLDLVVAGTQNVVMEVSAQGVHMGRVDGTEFSIGMFTNLTLDHLDFHSDMDAYVTCKKRFMNRIGSKKIGIYNVDDRLVQQTIRESGSRIFTYSVNYPEADLSAQIIEKNEMGSSFFVTISPNLQRFTDEQITSIPFRMHIPGAHNISNALAALLVGILSGLDPFVMKRALELYKPVTRRMEMYVWNGIQIIDDTAMNPGSLQAVLDSFHPEDYRKVHVVFAIRGNRGVDVNRENAWTLQKWYRKWSHRSPALFITSSHGHVGPNDRVIPLEESCFLNVLVENNIPFIFHSELTDVMESVCRAVNPGDILFLLGAQGMDDGFNILHQTWNIKDLVNP